MLPRGKIIACKLAESCIRSHLPEIRDPYNLLEHCLYTNILEMTFQTSISRMSRVYDNTKGAIIHILPWTLSVLIEFSLISLQTHLKHLQRQWTFI